MQSLSRFLISSFGSSHELTFTPNSSVRFRAVTSMRSGRLISLRFLGKQHRSQPAAQMDSSLANLKRFRVPKLQGGTMQDVIHDARAVRLYLQAPEGLTLCYL